jgi:hypothetical protein
MRNLGHSDSHVQCTSRVSLAYDDTYESMYFDWKVLTQREELVDISGKGIGFGFWAGVSLLGEGTKVRI